MYVGISNLWSIMQDWLQTWSLSWSYHWRKGDCNSYILSTLYICSLLHCIYSLPQMQHYSFFRNLPPLFSSHIKLGTNTNWTTKTGLIVTKQIFDSLVSHKSRGKSLDLSLKRMRRHCISVTMLPHRFDQICKSCVKNCSNQEIKAKSNLKS